MKDTKLLFGLLVIIGPLHMIEQMLFGLDELQEMKRLMAYYHSWFANEDLGTVVLVTISGASILLMMYGLIAGGRWKALVIALVGLFSAGEVHHLLRTALLGRYNPGLVTALPFAVVGSLLAYAAYLDFRSVPAGDHRRLGADSTGLL
jgi:hypothetical protein